MSQQILNTRYKILSELKKGGMGSIFLAEDTFLEKKVVVKILDINNFAPNDQGKMSQMFSREAKMLAKLEHPGLPRVTDFFIEENSYCLIMDYIRGQDLEEIRRRRKINKKELIKWTKKILDILEFLHNHNPPIIYRDMKPANIMLTNNGNIKLVDFGIARRLDSTNSTKKLDGKQTIIGTPGYAPWEQFYGKTDQRTDLYALGVTMHNLLTGISPTTNDIKPILSVRPKTDPKLAEFIKKATDPRPGERFKAARQMREALEEINKKPESTALCLKTDPIIEPDPMIKLIDYICSPLNIYCYIRDDVKFKYVKKVAIEASKLYKYKTTKKEGLKMILDFVDCGGIVHSKNSTQDNIYSYVAFSLGEDVIKYGIYTRLADFEEYRGNYSTALKCYQYLKKEGLKHEDIYSEIDRLTQKIENRKKQRWGNWLQLISNRLSLFLKLPIIPLLFLFILKTGGFPDPNAKASAYIVLISISIIWPFIAFSPLGKEIFDVFSGPGLFWNTKKESEELDGPDVGYDDFD